MVALPTCVIEQGVYRETSRRLVCDLNVLNRPLTIAAVVEFRDFHHHIVGREGFPHHALPRHDIIEIAVTCVCADRSGGGHAHCHVGSRPHRGGRFNIPADTEDFHKRQLHRFALPIRCNHNLLGSGLAAAGRFHSPCADLVYLELIPAAGAGCGIGRAIEGAGTGRSCRVGDINGGGKIVVGCFIVRYSTRHRHLDFGVLRLGIPVLRTVLDVIGVSDGDGERSLFLRLGESGGLGVLPVRLVHTGDCDAVKCAVIVNVDGDICRFPIGRSGTRPVFLIA